ITGLAVGPAEGGASNFTEIISEVGPLSPLAWTPEGRIVFRSDKDGAANLWTISADGSDRRQLTTEAQVDARGMCVTPDGEKIIFASARTGKLNLWQVDADGGNLTQLTTGEADAYPRCAPDGRWVVYQQSLYTKPTLWRVPLGGGEAQRLTDFRAKWPSVARDGKRIAYFHMDGGRWRLGILSARDDGGYDETPLRLDVPTTMLSNVLAWARDDRAFFYISEAGNVGNVWALPLDGGPPTPVTNFGTHSLEDFDVSPDGQRLALVRSQRLSDVVLVEDSP
ncbi:MAG TPA: DPP IV N-terminal domain-containing protein, partial [Pyrinomonadaceae bacterium]|nr:DPP IV N-terminal domain-containing protein [Pyrinomonadaceae bacterium]